MKEIVGIVLVCHSNSMADAFIEFCEVLKQDDFEILKANRGKGVLLLVDFGSSINAALGAKELLKGEIEVEIADCPLIEGAISAIAGNDEDTDLKTLKLIAEDSKNFRKIKS